MLLADFVPNKQRFTRLCRSRTALLSLPAARAHQPAEGARAFPAPRRNVCAAGGPRRASPPNRAAFAVSAVAMARFQTRKLPFIRLYNGVVYSISAAIYTGILAVLEWISPGVHVFLSSTSLRDLFMNISFCSWACFIAGATVLLVMYYPSKPRDKKLSSRYPEVTKLVLVLFALAFASIAVGLAASVAAAILVFIGSRERYALVDGTANTVRGWAMPLATGVLPAVFFLFMFYGALRSVFLCLAALHAGPGPAQTAAPASMPIDSPPVGVPLTPEHESLVAALASKGYTNRGANISALQASDFNLREAEARLARARIDVV